MELYLNKQWEEEKVHIHPSVILFIKTHNKKFHKLHSHLEVYVQAWSTNILVSQMVAVRCIVEQGTSNLSKAGWQLTSRPSAPLTCTEDSTCARASWRHATMVWPAAQGEPIKTESSTWAHRVAMTTRFRDMASFNKTRPYRWHTAIYWEFPLDQSDQVSRTHHQSLPYYIYWEFRHLPSNPS